MRQAVSATVALAVIIGFSEPTYALTNTDCQRAGGTVAPTNRLSLDFKCCFALDKGQAEFTSELRRKKVSKICWHCGDRPGTSCSFIPTFER
jgi:hypothetical protein